MLRPRLFFEFASCCLSVGFSERDMERAGRIPAARESCIAGTTTLKKYLAIGADQEYHSRPVKNLV